MTDIDRLLQVLDVARSCKLPIGAITVGDIRLVLATPTVPGAADAESPRAPTKEERELEQLRAASRKTFGRVLSDEELREMKGVL